MQDNINFQVVADADLHLAVRGTKPVQIKKSLMIMPGRESVAVNTSFESILQHLRTYLKRVNRQVYPDTLALRVHD